MDYFRNYYADPRQFGNWQQYAGMPTDRGFQATSSQSQGVAPPATISEMAQQTVGGAIQKIGNLGANISSAATQLGQGNVMQAANAAMGRPPAPSAPKAPAAPVVQDYDYESMVGQ